jgi:uncharacterized protein (DUF1778 family)
MERLIMSFRVSPQLKEFIEQIAESEFRNLTNFFLNAIAEHLRKNHDQETLEKFISLTKTV